jgi:ADP-glucose pyrophosphorylase
MADITNMNYDELLHAHNEIGKRLTEYCKEPRYKIGDSVVLPVEQNDHRYKWYGKVVHVETKAILVMEKFLNTDNTLALGGGAPYSEVIDKNGIRTITFYHGV